MEPLRLDDKCVIVTGAGSGIGLATVEGLVGEGARVIAVDISQPRLDDVRASYGDAVRYVAGDLTHDDTIVRTLAAADEHVDGLANVAGIMDGFEPTAEVDDATWNRVFAVNVTAMMRLTRAVLGPMQKRGSGSIVNVGSEAGLRGSAAGTAYTASKHAVNGFTLSTAFFYAPKGIRCNAVAPGPVATNIEAPFRSEWAAARLGPLMQVALPPIARPGQLASAIIWLLSDEASNVSGAILPVDGGWAAV